MTTVHVDYREPKEALERLEMALEETALRDPDWNGASFEIERDECTYIESDDELKGASLLHSVVYPALLGEQEID